MAWQIAANKIDNSSLISAVGMLPTICELAGAKFPATYRPDGVSQVAAILGTTLLPRGIRLRQTTEILNSKAELATNQFIEANP